MMDDDTTMTPNSHQTHSTVCQLRDVVVVFSPMTDIIQCQFQSFIEMKFGGSCDTPARRPGAFAWAGKGAQRRD